MTTTCPVCGTQCRIEGDPASVTRWYEPVEQAELEAVNETLRAAISRREDETLAVCAELDEAMARITELEAEKAAHVCRAAIIRTIRTPDLVIEEDATALATLCICGHPYSAHDYRAGCCQVVRPGEPNGIISRYCDCDEFKVRKVAE